MNIPWKVSDTQSQALSVTGGTPIPTADFTAVSDPVDVRGYDWVEFTVTMSANIGGSPVDLLSALVEYGEAAGPLAGSWYEVNTEDVDVTGLAPQNSYNPTQAVSGATDTWRLTVPVHGQQMRIKLKGNNGPDGTSTLAVHAYRRSF